MATLPSITADREAIAEHVERRFDQAGGHLRLEAELYRIAFDVLGRLDQDDPDAPDRDAVLRTTRSAVAASLEPLVARFISELARGVATLPPEARERLLRTECRRDLGVD